MGSKTKIPEHGDIFIHNSGGIVGQGKSFTIFSIFEYRENQEYGLGFHYTPAGNDASYFWAHPEESSHFENVPEDILFSFKHGTHSFHVDKEIIPECNDLEALIRASDFNFVKQGDIEIAKITENIKNIDDVRRNWGHINKYGVSYRAAEICFVELGIAIPPVYNGEIGIHCMMIMDHFKRHQAKIEIALKLNG